LILELTSFKRVKLPVIVTRYILLIKVSING
jgi:hypothetical protein